MNTCSSYLIPKEEKAYTLRISNNGYLYVYVEDSVGNYVIETIRSVDNINFDVPMFNLITNTKPSQTKDILVSVSGENNEEKGLIITYKKCSIDSVLTSAKVMYEGCLINSEEAVEETVTTENEPNLTITKSISPVPVTENGTLTYTFVIQNSGNTAAVATDNAVVTDLFDPILTNLSVSFNGVTWTEGVQYTYDETTGTFVTVAGQITVPAASYTQDPVTGVWVTNPGVSTLVVSGIV